ncbi:MAG: DNA circularization N-terminal domain-containing protein [Methylococcales bacterium]|nr:DNA circularization N-terminal domain-containing protein [Methylococcales bacterium]
MPNIIDNAQKLADALAPKKPKTYPAHLKDALRPASFRKIPFQVDTTALETGRRTQLHEYPQRDKPYAQDLGRSSRQVSFDAFVVGPDYIDQANALLGAMEEGGSGTLIHPFLGSLKVNATSCHVSFNKQLGHAQFSLSFIESGELAFPSSAESTAAKSRKAAAKLEAASVGWFAKIVAFSGKLKAIAGKITNIANKISDVSALAMTVYGQALQFCSNPVFALSSLLGFGSLPGNLTSLVALFGSPIDLGWSYAGLFNVSALAKDGTLISSDKNLAPMVRGLARMALNPVLAQPTIPTYTTATKAQALSNQIAILANTRHLLLVQAVGLSSYLECSVYDDILAVRNELAAALDAEALLTTDDDVYQALIAARSAMWADLTARSRDSARLSSITPDDVRPALAIAYDYYEDANRDLEIVARNKITNPGFVPVQVLKVLSR